MPPSIPDAQISNFLTHHTLPLTTIILPSTSSQDSECPICHQLYSEPPTEYVHPVLPHSSPEYAVQIHGHSTCTHRFGRHCIEQHLRSRQPWSHTCPICRAEWLPAPNGNRNSLLGHLDGALNALARVDSVDEEVRREVADTERALERIREMLMQNRWI